MNTEVTEPAVDDLPRFHELFAPVLGVLAGGEAVRAARHRRAGRGPAGLTRGAAQPGRSPVVSGAWTTG